MKEFAKVVAWVVKVLAKPLGWFLDAITWGLDKVRADGGYVADGVKGVFESIADFFRRMWNGIVAFAAKPWKKVSAPFKWAAKAAWKA